MLVCGDREMMSVKHPAALGDTRCCVGFEVPAQSLTMAERHLPLLWVYILGTAIQLTLGKGRISEKPRLLSWGRAWVALFLLALLP